MSSIDRDTVLKMAELSRIHLTDAEQKRFTGELGTILDYVSHLPDSATSPEPDHWLRLGDDTPRTCTEPLLDASRTDASGQVVVKAILDRE